MEYKKISVIEVDPELLKQPTGNLEFQCLDDFIEQFFLELPYVKIKGEKTIYHESQADQLKKRLEELMKEKDGNNASIG